MPHRTRRLNSSSVAVQIRVGRIGIGQMPMLGANTEPTRRMDHYSGQWPFGSDSLERCRLFFADLLDEMEAMAGDMDRCRWPFDEPWPHRH